MKKCCPQNLEITKEVCRSFYEYRIDSAGVVTKVGSPGPDLNISWTPGGGNNSGGNDYQITIATILPNMGAWVEIEGDVNTGPQGPGIEVNAYTTQNVSVVGNLATFTLYTGDDGGGVDDAKRRDAIFFLSFDKEFISNITSPDNSVNITFV